MLDLTAKKEGRHGIHTAYPRRRYQIYDLLKADHNQTEVAMILNRHKSTISRETQQNTRHRGYRPQQVQHLSCERKTSKAPTNITDCRLTDIVHPLQQD